MSAKISVSYLEIPPSQIMVLPTDLIPSVVMKLEKILARLTYHWDVMHVAVSTPPTKFYATQSINRREVRVSAQALNGLDPKSSGEICCVLYDCYM